MDVYLMQHGEAASEADDPARPLTAEGRDHVTKVSARARTVGVHVELVVHSGKTRAEQTATLLAAAVSADGRTEVRDGLSPNDPVAPVADWLASLGVGSIAVVGHLPFLDRLASRLVVGDEQAAVVRFRNGGLVKLEPRSEGGGYAVDWVLTPAIA